VLGRWLILLVEEDEPPSPLAWIAELPLGGVVALITITAIIPTRSKTVKITVNRAADCFLLRLKLVL
jgi:hypothetical protein